MSEQTQDDVTNLPSEKLSNKTELAELKLGRVLDGFTMSHSTVIKDAPSWKLKI